MTTDQCLLTTDCIFMRSRRKCLKNSSFMDNLKIRIIQNIIEVKWKMTVKEIIKKMSREYNLSEEDLLKKSMGEFLLRRKSEIETDILEILSRYGVKSKAELEEIVKKHQEHPAWEDLIVLENLYKKLEQLENDIKALSETV